MKIFKIILLSLITHSATLFAQEIDSTFSKRFGGSGTEVVGLSTLNVQGGGLAQIAVSPDSSIFISSQTTSTNGQVGQNFGNDDVWVVKLNMQGDTLWKRVLGGSEAERSYGLVALADGGCVVAGSTLSRNGIFSTTRQAFNGFIVRLSQNGTIVWTKVVGGAGDDLIHGIISTSDGGFLCVGSSSSTDGDLQGIGNAPGLAWVYKTNSLGDRQWTRVLNSYPTNITNAIEGFWQATACRDGSGFVVGGFGANNFSDPNADEIFIAKYSSTGTLLWQRLFGGPLGDALGNLVESPSGKIYLAGRAGGAGRNVSQYNGGPGDVWVIETNREGQLTWEKTYGGTDWEFAYDILMSPTNKLYVAGFTRSATVGTTPYGLQDGLILVLDTLGNTLKTIRAGGNTNDVFTEISMSEDGKFLVAGGRTDSDPGGWVSQGWGGRDLWVLAFEVDDCLAPSISVTPSNPAFCAGDSVLLVASGAGAFSWSPTLGLSDSTGQVVVAQPASTTTYTLTGIGTGSCNGTTTVTVTVNQNPTSPSISGDTLICSGNSNTLSSSYIAGNQWLRNDTLITGQVGQTLNTNLPGNYQVRHTTAQGCSATSSRFIFSVQSPITFITQPRDTFMGSPNPAIFTVDIAEAGAVFQWQGRAVGEAAFENLPNSAPYSGTNTDTLTVEYPIVPYEFYLRCLVTIGNCTDTSQTARLFYLVNNKPIAVKFSPLLVPNPASDQVMVSGIDAGKSMQLRLVNLQGKEVLKQVFLPGQAIKVDQLKPGLYQYHLEAEGVHFTGRWMKRQEP